MKCIACRSEFEGRSDARFCSSTCRSRHNRATDNQLILATDNYATDMDVPCKVVQRIIKDKGYIDIEKDLGLSLHKDLGITAWTDNGIFIRPDITVKQVHNIAHLVAAKHGRVAIFNECGK
jgi:hypothetical protein